MAAEIGDRLKKTLPPGLVDDEEDQSEEAQAAKAQAMQQAQQQQAIQQQVQELTIQEQQAKVLKMRAEAEKTMNEAGGMGQEVDPNAAALSQAELRKANADAAKAEADAIKAEVEAQRARVALEADIADLNRKPLEAAHSEADLDAKINPPAETESDAD